MVVSEMKAVLLCMLLVVFQCLLGASALLFDDVDSQCSDEISFTMQVLPQPMTQSSLYAISITGQTVVNRIIFDLKDCSNIDRTASTNVSLTYIDASDVLQLPRSYDKNFSGTMDPDFLAAYFDLDQPLYASTMAIVATDAFNCADIRLTGCPTLGMCKGAPCLNGGTCIGANMCACQAGYLGDTCKDRIEDIVVEQLGFQSMDSDTLHTTSGDLHVSGNVSLLQAVPKNFKRASDSSYLSFQGEGGNCSYVEKSGNKTRRTLGFLYGLSNVFGNLLHHGFTHTSTLHFGHHHNHHHRIYLFNTHHNWNTNNIGSSLYYNDHRLKFTVNTGHSSFRMDIKWKPKWTYLPHMLTSSYSPNHGLSLFANGIHLGSSARPHSFHSHGNHWGGRLCFGSHCGYNVHVHGHGPLGSYLLNNVRAVATSAANLALNGLAGLAGLPFNRNAISTTTKLTATTIPTTTTTSTTTVATTTKAVTTTKAATTATTTLPVTATAASTNSSSRLLCYSCTRMGTDGACITPQLCQPGEVCALFHDPNGYTHRCLDDKVCSNAKAMVGGKGCWECCTSSLCNQRCAPAVQCSDTSKCALLQSTGFSVCAVTSVATTDCKKTCGNCGGSG